MSKNENIKVLIVDDSVLVRKYLSRIITELEMEVVATASDGKIGLQKMLLFSPDVVILDIEMPEMNGIDFLKYLKAHPEIKKPHIIVFSSLIESDPSATFDALNYGANELIKKPDGNIQENIEYLKKEFKIKIEGLYFSRKEKIEEKKEVLLEKVSPVPYGLNNFEDAFNTKRINPEIVAIGSSTGGPVALRKIIGKLNPLPVPVVIAQHMPAGFTNEFAKNLEAAFRKKVKESEDGEILENGAIYICPGGKHARIFKNNGSLLFKEDNNEYDGVFFKPSVDIFFRSVRESLGDKALAVILTGIGRDGAKECVNLKKSGAFVIAQDEQSSVVWGMPGNAVKNGGADIVLSVEEIGDAINKFFS
ncbi:MAG: chemotaxis-specific protein-glutamate methyltransferase CheB [Brevinematia bacterium]